VVFRADAAFAKPELYAALEERNVKYAIRLPANETLERNIGELLTRPVGRLSFKPVVRLKHQMPSLRRQAQFPPPINGLCGEELFDENRRVVRVLFRKEVAALHGLSLRVRSPLPPNS
jgi:Transposase DDE domain group 1